jgi:phosphatidylglycerophosphate synthase
MLPGILTGVRAAIGLVLLAALPALPAAWLLPLAGAAAATDILDGWLARRAGRATPFGAAFDLAADGVFFLACLVAFWRLGIWPDWLLVLILSSGVPEAAAQLVRLRREGTFGSPGRFWNRAVGAYGYACILIVFAGSHAAAWGVLLAVIAWAANVADLVWALRRTRREL